jgi:catechol 2,3-dioxygenase-like lactoylglutathione lyase family enzyme
MKQSIVHVALVVRDYDEAIAFYTQKLNFELIEDTYQPEQDKRWVVVAPWGHEIIPKQRLQGELIVQLGDVPSNCYFFDRLPQNMLSRFDSSTLYDQTHPGCGSGRS